MPLPKRCVEPVHVSRGTVPERLAVPSELEAVTNGTLANTVRQLSSLSKHAEDMFGELTREASNLAERTNVLQARIDRLAIKVTQLDSGVEEVSLQDIQMRKAFRSSRTFQQQLFSRNSMPTAMLATYARCDRPPPLERLNEFRDDGRDARKFYTDPDYFFELWRREMLQDTERIQHDRGKKVRQPRSGGADGRGARRVRPPHSTRERQKAAAVTRGEHIMAPAQLRHYNIEPQPPPLQTQLSQQSIRQESVYGTSIPDGGYRAGAAQAARPNSIEIDHHQNRQPRLTGNGHVMVDESPYGSVEPIYGGSGAGTPRRPRPSVPPPAPPADTPNNHTPTRCVTSGLYILTDVVFVLRSTLPPPPPPPEGTTSPPMMNGASPPHRTALDAHLDHMHAVIGMMSSEEPGAPPGAPAPLPPPAPPAPPAMPAPPPAEERPRPPSPGSLLRGASALKPPRPAAEPKEDPRSDLLKAIRDGIKLRKVDKRGDETTGRYDTLRGAPAFLDVASILARRVAVELSDTSSGADSDSDDSDQWTTESRA
ncbi:actin-binding protein WASF3 [Cydia pomonella]|uniref:actin-binding protein WASF3 n=1 Tax=Cydia pomonella TaxID=82600 RepID=UPI002ADD3F99|nr:actin-binding protein WASF3 [Cydia pomonella]